MIHKIMYKTNNGYSGTQGDMRRIHYNALIEHKQSNSNDNV